MSLKKGFIWFSVSKIPPPLLVYVISLDFLSHPSVAPLIRIVFALAFHLFAIFDIRDIILKGKLNEGEGRI